MRSRPVIDLDHLRSPKLKPADSRRWYRYYAGYSTEFVDDILGQLQSSEPRRLLDPWAGSGTTLAVGAGRGLSVAGLDLNPAMVVIARGRLVADDTIASVAALRTDILRHWQRGLLTSAADDPLSQWFDVTSVALLRGLIERVNESLVEPGMSAQGKANGMSSLAAFFYVALFETVTGAIKSYASRNPTWIKRASPGSGTVSFDQEQIEAAFTQAVKRLTFHVKTSRPITADERDRAALISGDSRALPFEDNSHDIVITSPPYLTRLDYVVGHLPELAVLGVSIDEVKALRDAMIGTPTMGGGKSLVDIGAFAEGLLDSVAAHGSRAAASYYEPNFRKYFEGMADSLIEIERVCAPESDVILVVQDSRFKDVHVDLASALRCMAAERGWSDLAQRDFINVRSMAQVNKRAHETARTTKPIESVISLRTPTAAS